MTTNQGLLQMVYNESSFCFGTAATRVCLTRQCGAMAPVTFFADTPQPVEPYFIAPWWNEGISPEFPTLLNCTRGDFFCAPFGGNDEPVAGRKYPLHGETANERWQMEEHRLSKEGAAIHLSQRQTAQPGLVRKSLAVLDKQNVVYSRHVLEGMEGPMCLGHHPTMHVPDSAGQGYLSFAPHRLAHTYVELTAKPAEEKGYSMLKPNTIIDDLTRCPTLYGGTTDLTRYPNRRGFEDIVMICAAEGLEFGWTAFAAPSLGYVWFSLKDPRVLASTLLWMSNGGRHSAPWNGRNLNTLGIEEITAFFHEGLASSAKKNFINEMGIPTSVMLDPAKPLAVNFIQGVARISPDFAGVLAIEPLGRDAIRIVGAHGKHADAAVDLDFLGDGKLKDLID